MSKRLWMAALLAAAAALSANAFAKEKDKDKGKVEVALVAPVVNASYTAPAAIALSASAASDQSNHPVVQVQFFQGATLLGTATQAPYALNWANVAAGNYVLTAVAVNDKGDSATSTPVAINVNAPPTVGITSPAFGASFTGPINVAIAAAAADSDGSIARVEFYNGQILLGTATGAPYVFNWSGVAPVNYTISARAIDNQGAATTSAALDINVNAVPVVSLTAPANNASHNAPASMVLTANAMDSDGSIAKVDFFNGAILLGTAISAPYSFAWTNVAAGNYTISAKATDNQGATASSAAVAVNVNAPPTVGLTGPANNASYNAPASIALTANASDSDGTIARVEFYQGATLLGIATSAPYTFTWTNVVAGNYAITARAIDNQGAATTSIAIAVNVNALPTVSLSTPANNSVVTAPANITLTASAADSDGTIARVEFFNGTTLLGTATAAPYTVNWTNVAAGNYTITAKATDNQGATAVSTAVAINVNTPPTVSLTAPSANASYISPAAITLTAAAADTDGTIAKVEFFQGSTLLGTAVNAPYSIQWTNAAPGNYLLSVRATDNQGGTTVSAPVAITVAANKLPTVALALPVENQRFTAPASLILEAGATDADGTIAKVEFYQDGTLLATLTEGPYLYHWTKVAAGNYAISAKATDNLGGEATSVPVNVTVVANALPTVALTATPANATAPAAIKLEATAEDADGTIAKVEFFNGGTLLGTATSAPYRFDWSNVEAGEYTVIAKATDNLDGTMQSSAVTVKVSKNVTQAYYIYADHLNTPRVITDSANNIVWRWDNADPFGYNLPDENPSGLGTFTFDLRFPGMVADRETGLFYNYLRDCYDPATGRYCQADPIGLAGGINPYVYVLNQPTRYVDPLGLQAVPVPAPTPAPAPGGVTVPGGKTTGGYDPAKDIYIPPSVSTGINPLSILCRVAPLACAAGVIANEVSDEVCPPASGDKDPRTPTGRRGNPMDVAPGTNGPTNIGGRDYSGHAVDRMQGRGMPPSVVEDTINNGQASPGNRPGTTVYTGPNGTVVTGDGGRVVTVIPR